MKILNYILIGLGIVILLIFAFVSVPPNQAIPTAFVVLGYSLKENDSEEINEARINGALSNCKSDISYVILTGGKEYDSLGMFRIPLESNNTEAKKMKEIWANNNKDCNATLLLEENSYNTFQNAYNTIKLAKGKEINSLVVFTNKKHLLYASSLFYLNKLILLSNAKIEFKAVEPEVRKG